MPRVSIVISCYNLGEYLADAVASARSQTLADCEIIVADDGSKDGTTRQVLENMVDPSVRILRLPHAGLPATRNRGIATAAGEFVCCLDADDRYHPAFAERCLKTFDTASDIGIVSTWLETFGDSSVVWKPAPESRIALAANNCIHVASMFRRKAWEQTGGFRNEMSAGYEDWDFWLSVVLAGWRCAVVPEILFFYRRRRGSMISGSHTRGPELYRRIIERHKAFYQENLVEILVEKQRQISEFQALSASQDELIRQRDALLRSAQSELHDYSRRIANDDYVFQELIERSGISPDGIRLLKAEGEIRMHLEEFSSHLTRKPLPVAIMGAGSRGRLVLSCLDREFFRVEALFDNRQSALGTEMCGVRVQSPVFMRGLTVLVASVESSAIRDQLEGIGYPADSIVEV